MRSDLTQSVEQERMSPPWVKRGDQRTKDYEVEWLGDVMAEGVVTTFTAFRSLSLLYPFENLHYNSWSRPH